MDIDTDMDIDITLTSASSLSLNGQAFDLRIPFDHQTWMVAYY